MAQDQEIPAIEKGIIDKIIAKFGEQVKLSYARPKRIRFDVTTDNIKEFAKFIKELGFDHPISVAGTDYPKDNAIEVIYHIDSCSNDDYRAIVLAFAVRVPRDNPKTPTLMDVYEGVEYHERETFEMLGVIFEGHRKLDRLLLPEDWADMPPLRKDFQIKGR
ncbi:MAG: NADH-quinone oxidoreductase subunit C [Candidatus Nitrosocaldaceae archaeon]|nr:MAG: NADH-quinone oxidoreductase subunit C [Candidatus Nitrosocaldaceae archaeon]